MKYEDAVDELKKPDIQAVFEQSVMLRPLVQTFQIEETDSSYSVTWRHFSATVISYIFIVALLSLFCFLGTAKLVNKMEPNMLCFMIAIWTLWICYFGGLLNTLFGKTKFVLDNEGLEATWTCLLYKQKTRIDINNIDHFKREDYPRKRKHERKAGNWATRIRVVCNKGYFDYVVPISIINAIAQKEFDDMCDQLNVCLISLKPEEQEQCDEKMD
jgi:hypothetical protein